MQQSFIKFMRRGLISYDVDPVWLYFEVPFFTYCGALCRLDMSFGTREEAVRGVWRGWIRLAAGAAPSPAAIRRERDAWVVHHVANKPGSRVTTAEAAAESLAITTLARFKSFMTSDGVDGFQVATCLLMACTCMQRAGTLTNENQYVVLLRPLAFHAI